MRYPALLVLACSCLLSLSGCNSEEKMYAVTGKVSFNGVPVTEGTIQFIDDSTGKGAEVELQAEGQYQANLPVGNYRVMIAPPYLVDESSGLPNPVYKKVKNIPEKYQSTETSGFSAVVDADKLTHDFDMK